jgi:L-iditol 2-dehydrogenase
VRAYLVRGPGQHGLCEIDEPKPGRGDVLVAPAAVGICGSDRELLDGRRPAKYVRYPVIPGHEWAGHVVGYGPDVAGLSPGQAIVAEGIRACGQCARCAEGRNNLCERTYAETGFTHPGALAERLVVPSYLVHPLPGDRPIAVATLLEPAACVAGGLLDVGGPRAGSRVAVVGDGQVGLLAVYMLALATPRELLLLGYWPKRLAIGPQIGATAVAVFPELSTSERSDLCGRFDVVVNCTDTAAGAAFSIDLARRGGTVLAVGICGERRPSIDPDTISLNHLRVQGVFGASRAGWQWLLDLYRSGLFDPAALITHRYELNRADEAFAILADPAAGAVKVLVEPGAVAPHSNSTRSMVTQV